MVSQKGFRNNCWHFESKKKTYRQNQINWPFQYGDVINPWTVPACLNFFWTVRGDSVVTNVNMAAKKSVNMDLSGF